MFKEKVSKTLTNGLYMLTSQVEERGEEISKKNM